MSRKGHLVTNSAIGPGGQGASDTSADEDQAVLDNDNCSNFLEEGTLDKKYAPFITVGLNAILLPFFLTLAVSLFTAGGSEHFFALWLRAWVIASITAVPVLFLLSPVIRRLVEWLVGETHKQ